MNGRRLNVETEVVERGDQPGPNVLSVFTREEADPTLPAVARG